MTKSLYIQVKEHILGKSSRGTSASATTALGKRIVKTLRVSAITVKRAFLELQNEGIVDRKQGVGSFVAESRANRSLGVLLPDVRNSVYAGMLHGIENIAIGQGFKTIVGNSANDYDKFRNYIDMFVSDRVAGMILAPIQDTYDVFQNIRILRNLQEQHIPFVLIDRYIEDIEADHVVTNNEEAACELTTHLMDNGARRIAFFTEPVCSSNEDRLRGYRKVLIDNGLDFDRELIFISDQRAKKAGIDLAARLIEKNIACDAIFCANDWVAYGAMEYLIEHGVRIPEDIAVTGFDDLPIANQTQVSLTTMHQPAEEIGQTAAELLMERLANPATLIKRQVLPSRLIVRDSSKTLSRNQRP